MRRSLSPSTRLLKGSFLSFIPFFFFASIWTSCTSAMWASRRARSTWKLSSSSGRYRSARPFYSKVATRSWTAPTKRSRWRPLTHFQVRIEISFHFRHFVFHVTMCARAYKGRETRHALLQLRKRRWCMGKCVSIWPASLLFFLFYFIFLKPQNFPRRGHKVTTLCSNRPHKAFQWKFASVNRPYTKSNQFQFKLFTQSLFLTLCFILML